MKDAPVRYPFHVRWSDEDGAYVGSIPGLIGECCHGDAPEVVISQLKEIGDDLIEYLEKNGKPVPHFEDASSEPDPALARKAMGLSQAEFARLLDVSVKTLHKWEQHVARPSGAARALLRVATSNPQALKKALSQGH